MASNITERNHEHELAGSLHTPVQAGASQRNAREKTSLNGVTVVILLIFLK